MMRSVTAAGLARHAAAAASGLLLATAFPPLEWGWAAWIALVPLLAAVRGGGVRAAARLGFLAGAAFWLPSIFWLTRVTVVGWALLSLYCALYTVPFAVCAAWLTRPGAEEAPAWRLRALLILTAAWTGFEFLRSVLFTGFAWNPLAVSQYRNLMLIQHAEWGGTAAVSALVAWVNVTAALALLGFARRRAGAVRFQPEVSLGLLVVVLAAFGGWRLLARVPEPDARARLALVQPAVPQYAKWDEAFVDRLYADLRTLSVAAARGDPDLLVWPETAVPDELRASDAACDVVRAATSNGVTLLAGAIDGERTDAGEALYYNTSFLLAPGLRILDKYDKQHLVIFGEYVPLARWLPFLKTFTPIVYYITPGRVPTVFRTERPPGAFSVMICFEDTVAALARDFVRRGARMLITQTNDAWFDPSSGSRQHMLHCVFRCVENRVPVARCSNSGVTCWIDATGRIGGDKGESGGSLPTGRSDGAAPQGFLAAEVPYRATPGPATFYTRHGDVFGWAMAAAALLSLAAALWPARRAARP